LARSEYWHTKGKPEPNLNSDILDVRHDFAQKIGELSAHWNVLDLNTLSTFMILLAGEEELSFELYYDVLRGESRQRDKALQIAATTREAPEGVLDQIRAFFKAVDKVRKDRNDVVHASWASVEGSDSLFAAKDKTEWLRNSNAIIAWNLAIRRGDADGQIFTGLPIHHFWEYRLSDIQEIIDEIKALCDRLHRLQRKISILCFLRPVPPPWQRAESIVRRLRTASPSEKNEPEALPLDQPPD